MLIVGLGNPGKEYFYNRHNIGFRVVDLIATSLGLTFKTVSKFKAEVALGNINNNRIIVIKPLTFMNLSGESVSSISSYYKIDTSDIIVFHDELDLAIGKIKYKLSGGSAGHNGIKSIDKYIGSNYHRIRLGIGRPFDKEQVANYVLSNFTSEDNISVEKIFDYISKHIPDLLEKDFSKIAVN